LPAVLFFSMKLPNLRAGAEQFDAMRTVLGDKTVNALAASLAKLPKTVEGYRQHINQVAKAAVTPQDHRLYLVFGQAGGGDYLERLTVM
jgi:hypothetical protein